MFAVFFKGLCHVILQVFSISDKLTSQKPGKNPELWKTFKK